MTGRSKEVAIPRTEAPCGDQRSKEAICSSARMSSTEGRSATQIGTTAAPRGCRAAPSPIRPAFRWAATPSSSPPKTTQAIQPLSMSPTPTATPSRAPSEPAMGTRTPANSTPPTAFPARAAASPGRRSHGAGSVSSGRACFSTSTTRLPRMQTCMSTAGSRRATPRFATPPRSTPSPSRRRRRSDRNCCRIPILPRFRTRSAWPIGSLATAIATGLPTSRNTISPSASGDGSPVVSVVSVMTLISGTTVTTPRKPAIRS